MRRVLAGLLLLTLTQPGLADGLHPGQVSADAKWVIHVDFDAARQSQIGKAIHARLMKELRVQRALTKMQDGFGFDPTKDLHSATFYDNRFSAHRSVAIIELANVDRDRLVARLKKDKPGHTTTEHAGHTIYTWTEAEGRRHEHQVNGSFFGDRHMVFSREADKLSAALDVLDGKANSLPRESPLGVDATSGAVLVARAVGMAGQKTPFRSSVIQDARQLSLTFGEVDDDVIMQAMLVADSGETAARLRAMIEGLFALAQIQAGDDPLAKKVMDGLNLVVADATIVGEWRVPSQDVLQLMEIIHKKYRARAKQRRQDRDSDDRDPGGRGPDGRDRAEQGEKHYPAEL
jgi:hypothetical protein